MTKTIKIPQTLSRSAVVTREKSADGSENVKVSISSDTPYKRYDYWNDEEYYEVLSHAPGDIDTTRLAAGLPMLFNHDRDAHLGRASGFTIAGGKCYVDGLKWSEGEDAQTKKKDMESGALPDTSVGYQITDDGECVGAQDGIPIYKFKWSPYEFSLVTVPADITVGAGRSEAKPNGDPKEIRINDENNLAPAKQTSHKRDNEPKNSEKPMKLSPSARQHFRAPDTDEAPAGGASKVDVVKERGDAVKAFQADCKKIDDWVKAITRDDWRGKASEVAAKHKADKADFDAFRSEALNSFEGVTRVETESAEIGMSKKERKSYSLCELMRKGIAGELRSEKSIYTEASEAVAKLTRRAPEGIYIPDDIVGHSLQEIHGIGSRQLSDEARGLERAAQIFARAMSSTNYATGGALVGTDLLTGSLIELLLNKVVFLDGMVTLGGLVGNVAIPRVTGPTANSYWLPEGGTVTGSDMTFSQLGLTPHRLAATMAYDKQLVAQASLSVEALVRDYIARIMAVEKNRAMINGSGVNGQPLGVLNVPGVQTVSFNSAGAPTWAELVSFETKIGTANAELGPMSWLSTPTVRGYWKATPKIGTTFPVFIWDESGKVNGYPVGITNNVPSNLAIFGVGSEFVSADWAGIDIVVNPYSLDTSGQIRTTVQMWTDNGLRHEVAFVVSTNAAGA